MAPQYEKKPAFRISLAEKPGKHILEREPRFDVLVNGEPQGELYFNMTGYVGYLPTVQGSKMDIGERAISAFRKEVAALNRDAIEAIEQGASNARRLALTFPTTDGSTMFAISRDVVSGTDEAHLLSRREVLQAETIFGSKDVGLTFFSEHGFDRNAAPVVLFDEDDLALAAGLTDVRHRFMDRVEAETHQRYIEHVFKTTDDEVRVIVSRRVVDDFDAEPEYVNRLSLEMARARYGDAMRFSDLQVSEERPAVVGNEARSLLARDFTWFDIDDRNASDVDPEP